MIQFDAMRYKAMQCTPSLGRGIIMKSCFFALDTHFAKIEFLEILVVLNSRAYHFGVFRNQFISYM